MCEQSVSLDFLNNNRWTTKSNIPPLAINAIVPLIPKDLLNLSSFIQSFSLRRWSSMAYRRSTTSSIFDAFSLYPLPYPVLLILAMISIFLGTSWYFSYEEAVESAEVQMGWLLLATPIALLILVRWLSSMENPDFLFSMSPWDQRRRTHHRPSEGSSPWGVAALIVLLLVMVQYRSVFTDGWLV